MTPYFLSRNWLPTISDCGAWGYKSLPFPPYGNEDMLDFYETLDVTVGVTIDHPVLGSERTRDGFILTNARSTENSTKATSPIPSPTSLTL